MLFRSDATQTAMGGRLLKKWLDAPLLSVEQINHRLDRVEAFALDPLVRGDVRDALRGVSDMERLIGRLCTGTANARDLVALRCSLEKIPQIAAHTMQLSMPAIQALAAELDGLPELTTLLARAVTDEPPVSLREGGLIRDGYDETLDELQGIKRGGKGWIAELETAERDATGIKSLKIGFTSVFGYFIEVTKPNLPLVPAHYIRKQTTSTGERYITPDLKDMEAKVDRKSVV